MNEIDRCIVCGGAGSVFHTVEVTITNGHMVADSGSVPYPCLVCRGRGAIDPVASLARAVELGQCLAWCATHARDGDPLPGMWANATRDERDRIARLVMGVTHTESVWGPHVEALRRWGERGPALAEVLDAARRRRSA